jgi:hypothetical protein
VVPRSWRCYGVAFPLSCGISRERISHNVSVILAPPQGGGSRVRSPSRPSRRSRSISCAGPTQPACRAAWSCWTPAMAITASCALTPPRWARPTWPAFCRRPRCGRPAPGRCRQKHGRAVHDDQRELMRRDDGLGQGACAQTAEAGLANHRWREGAAEPLRSRFARLRIRAAHRDYRPRGSAAPARTSYPKLDRHYAPAPHRRPGQNATAMSLLRRANRKTITPQKFLTQ